MKKLLMFTLCILLMGCTEPQEEVMVDDVPHYSEHFIDDNYLSTYVRNADYGRLEAIQSNEITQFVYLNGTTEVSVTDKDELAKVSELFQSFRIENDDYNGESMEDAIFVACYVKGHDEPIRFAVNDYILEGNDFHHVNKNLSDEIINLKGDEKEVLEINVNSNLILDNTNWADLIYKEKQAEEQKWKDVLQLGHVIHEDFDDVRKIKDQLDLVGGLSYYAIINKSLGYKCFENYYCTNEAGDQLALDNSSSVGNVYSALPYALLEKTGQSVFPGYQLPDYDGLVYDTSWVQSAYMDKKNQVVTYHFPYEIWFADSEKIKILDMQEKNNVRTYRVIKYATGFEPENEWIIFDENGNYKFAFLSDKYEDEIEVRQDEFIQWEYVLRKNGENIEFVSAKKINDGKSGGMSNAKLDESKPAFYLEEGRPIVNMQSNDATIFNYKSDYIDETSKIRFKSNVYENYLSILKRTDYFTDAYVFDLSTGKLLNDYEIMQIFKLDPKKINETVEQVYPNCKETFCLPDMNEFDSYKADIESKHHYTQIRGSNLFISSDGKPAVRVSNCESDVVVMEWEEVQ